MDQNLKTTAWDHSNVYKGFDDPQIQMDIKIIEATTQSLKTKIAPFGDMIPELDSLSTAQLEDTLPTARRLHRDYLDAMVLAGTLSQYASMALSVNSKNAPAKDLSGLITKMSADLAKEFKPLEIFLMRAPETYFEKYFSDPSVNEVKFLVGYSRKMKDFLMSVPEEVLTEGLSVDGLHAWGDLYDDLSGSIKVKVDGKEMGLAQASNLLYQGDRPLREKAYKAINDGWSENEVSAGAILNAINGWRLEESRARSRKRELHYLDTSTHQQRITRATLNAMIDTTYEYRHVGQKALGLMAKELGLGTMAPWDLAAPFPGPSESGDLIPYPEAIEIIAGAFDSFNKDLGDFARLMAKKNWIDGGPSENRMTGAYCSGLTKVREPRIFITYDGSMSNVITLAHEIGHAYHSWVMKDLPLGQTRYSMPLAETASIFAETLVRTALLEKAKDTNAKKLILWQELDSASALLINIPTRFDFEKQLVETRMKKNVTPKELKEMMKNAWAKWYETSVTEYNDMFWASKLHFSISSLGFYNYTYLFGYLFSLSLYGRKDSFGPNFKETYIQILRDTGSMTAEDLIKKYLKEDIEKKDFWVKALKTVEGLVDQYEAVSK